MQRFVGTGKYTIISILFLLIFNLPSKELMSQSTDTIKINVTQVVYDTIVYADTVISYDTIWIERKIDAWAISAEYSPFFTNWRGINPIKQTLENKLNSSFGLSIGVFKGDWSLYSGLRMSQLSNKVTFNYQFSNIDTLRNNVVTSVEYYTVDTVSTNWEYFINNYYIGDTLVTEVDSTQHFNLDSTQNFNYDTTVVITYDTISIDTSTLKHYSFQYFEIPIITKYKFANIGMFDFDLGIGLLAGFLYKSESYYFDDENQSIILYSDSDTFTFFPSLWLSFGVNFYYQDRFGVSIEPYYAYGLRLLYNKEIISQRIPDRYGVKFGLSYKF